jgi:hypothetical protein
MVKTNLTQQTGTGVVYPVLEEDHEKNAKEKGARCAARAMGESMKVSAAPETPCRPR